MYGRLLRFAVCLAAAVLVVVPAARAQNVEVTFSPLLVEPPDVEAGVTAYDFFGDSVWFPLLDANNAVATIWYGVYVESESVRLESLRLSLEWTGNEPEIVLDAASVEGGILYGPEGYLARRTNPFLVPDNFVSPVPGAFDFGLAPGLLPSMDAMDLAGLVAFQVSVDESDYANVTASYEIRVGVLQDDDEILAAGGGSPTFKGQPIVQGENPAIIKIFLGGDPVPEPTTAAMLVPGTALLALLERRRARR